MTARRTTILYECGPTVYSCHSINVGLLGIHAIGTVNVGLLNKRATLYLYECRPTRSQPSGSTKIVPVMCVYNTTHGARP